MRSWPRKEPVHRSRFDIALTMAAVLARPMLIEPRRPEPKLDRVPPVEPPPRLNHRGQPFTEADAQAIEKARLRQERRAARRRAQK